MKDFNGKRRFKDIFQQNDDIRKKVILHGIMIIDFDKNKALN